MHHLAFPIEKITFDGLGKHPILKSGGEGGNVLDMMLHFSFGLKWCINPSAYR